jgi:hypothetical protein
MKNTFRLMTTVSLLSLYACSNKSEEALTLPVPEKLADVSINAAAPNVAVSFTDESAFVATLSSYGFKSPTDIVMNRTGTTSGYTSVYGFNIPADRQVKGFKWNADDETTITWRPQGITGFKWGTRNFLLVTWYAIGPTDIAGVNNQHKGVRVTLVDITSMSNITYRHILLVQNTANRSNSDLYKASNTYTQLGVFAPVTIHAGGVTYYAGKIYVADTKLGFRVFDLTKFVPAADDATLDRIGKETNGVLKAFNYSYILPQTGYYKATNASPFSFIELGDGTTTAEKRLFTGQYVTAATGGSPKIYGFPISTTGAVTTGASAEVFTPLDADGTAAYNMQGAYRTLGKNFITITGQSSYLGSTARLLRFNDGSATGSRYRWPHGAEDLYLETSTGYLWNLTEYETSKYGQDNRCVFAVRLADYN